VSETNGQSRLDRIEAIIERQERANEAAHERFKEEDKRLLTAQILMNAALEKTENAVEKMVSGMITLELKMQETTEKLNALIHTVDGIIRKPDRPQAYVHATSSRVSAYLDVSGCSPGRYRVGGLRLGFASTGFASPALA
jgi:hypothetical protein